MSTHAATITALDLYSIAGVALWTAIGWSITRHVERWREAHQGGRLRHALALRAQSYRTAGAAAAGRLHHALAERVSGICGAMALPLNSLSEG